MHEAYYIPSGVIMIEDERAFFQPISGVCPHCEHNSVFEMIGPKDCINPYISEIDRQFSKGYAYSVRRCPGCKGAVFFISEVDENKHPKEFQAFPPRKLKVEKEGVPPLVTQLLTEALQCFSVGCYRASAIMIRRTLEEICAEVGAEGRDLHHRIQDLPNKTTLNQRFIDAMMQLKYLGNDAAHIELKTFDQIGREEVDLGLELLQEIIRSWFKFLHLEGKLKSLHKTP